MADDPVRLADTKAWIGRAALDIRAARLDLGADPPLRDDAVFHCQQAVEKCFKAWLTWHDVPFRKTHSIEEIGAACIAIDAAVEPLVTRAAPLSEYAWKFRYPGEEREPTTEEAADALSVALAVWTAVIERLPPDMDQEEPRP